MLRIVYFGNSESSYSIRYLEAFQQTACDIVAVVDSPSAIRGSTTTAAQHKRAEFAALPPWRGKTIFEPANPNLPEFVDAMRALAPDLFVAVGYMGLFRETMLGVPRLLAVNFHASLLPAYRGKHPVFWALRNGERWSGLTVHAVDRSLDTGDILYQVGVRTRRNDTPAELYDRIVARSLWLPSRLVRDAEQGVLPRRPQPSAGASYHSSVAEEDFRLDWSRPAERLRRMIQVSPGRCYADVVGHRLFFLGAEVVRNVDEVPAGTLLRLDRTTGLVKCGGDGALRVRCAAVAGSDARALPEICGHLGIQPGALLST